MTLAFRLILLLLLMVRCFSIHAQSDEPIRCRIIDSSNHQPIPFASVQLKGKMIGVISNADGDFQLPQRARLSADTIIISCIGYPAKQVRMSQLRNDQLNTLQLTPLAVKLSEVVINGKPARSLSATRIVETAIERIPENYPLHPFSYVGYYRDYQIKKDSNQYINLNEAIVEAFDNGFNTSDQRETKIKLYEFQENRDFLRDTLIQTPYDNKLKEEGSSKFIPNAYVFPYSGNELSILRLHDAIRNYQVQSFSFINQLDKDFVKNHFFKREEAVFLDDGVLYVLSFRGVHSVTGSSYAVEGKIYIEKGNYAIYKIEYTCYSVIKKIRALLFDLQLEYGKRDNQMYLSYISFNNLFNVSDGKEFKLKDIGVNAEASALILHFNHEVDHATALDKANYRIKIDNENMEITDLEVNKKDVIVMLAEKEKLKLSRRTEVLNKQLKIDIQNLIDMDKRELGKIYLTPVQQFREFFVQKINTDKSFLFDGSMLKDIPLDQNIKQTFADLPDYWMNSPLKGLK